MRFTVIVVAAFLFSSSLALAAEGVRVYVNGKDVTGKRHIKLKNVSVRFDPLGNVHVGAPAYTVKPPPSKDNKPSHSASVAAAPGAPAAKSDGVMPKRAEACS